MGKDTMSSKAKKSPRSEAIERLTKRTRDRPDGNKLWNLILDAKTDIKDDAALALVVSSIVEQGLEIAIATHLVISEDEISRLFDDTQNGPFSTSAAKIKIGHALGVYDARVRDELNMIRHIRNCFAHSKEQVTFASEEVVLGCNQLWVADLWHDADTVDKSNPRDRFLSSAKMMFVYLENSLSQTPRRFTESEDYKHIFGLPPSPEKSAQLGTRPPP
jgi:hypothetical protein